MRNTTYIYNNKQYELSNHIGNVLVTSSYKRIGKDINSDNIADYYNADVSSANDYGAFGNLLAGRQYNSTSYHYGFSGKIKDDEIKGSGNSIDYGGRFYDTRIGKWMSIEPMFKKYSGYSPYNYVANSPLIFIDSNGDNITLYIEKTTDYGGEPVTTSIEVAIIIDNHMDTRINITDYIRELPAGDLVLFGLRNLEFKPLIIQTKGLYELLGKVKDKAINIASNDVDEIDAVQVSASGTIGVGAVIGVSVDLIKLTKSTNPEQVGDVNMYFTLSAGNGLIMGGGSNMTLIDFKECTNEDLEMSTFKGPSFTTNYGYCVAGYSRTTSYGNNPVNFCYTGLCDDEVLYNGVSGGVSGASKLDVKAGISRTFNYSWWIGNIIDGGVKIGSGANNPTNMQSTVNGCGGEDAKTYYDCDN